MHMSAVPAEPQKGGRSSGARLQVVVNWGPLQEQEVLQVQSDFSSPEVGVKNKQKQRSLLFFIETQS